MFNHSIHISKTLIAVALCLSCLSASAQAQTTAFTYQGRLTDNGSPADGFYDFEFKLFNMADVGTGTPNDKLEVNGIIRVSILALAGGLALCRNPLNQIAECASSLRYKTNIAPFSSGLSFINQLRPITFDWKQGGMKDIGFGAEDVARINPLFVTHNSKGEVEGVKYDRLSAAFVNAFKEQQAQIENQQHLIERQQQQIEALKKLVCSSLRNAKVCK